MRERRRGPEKEREREIRNDLVNAIFHNDIDVRTHYMSANMYC